MRSGWTSPQEALVTAIEDNFVEFWAHYGRAPQREFHDDPDILWFVTGIPHAFFNGVIRAQLEPDNVDAKIDSVLTHFKSHKLPFQWNTGPTPARTALR